MTSSVTNNSALSLNNTQTKKSSTLDQEAFLKLMTTQLKTQDPFDPVDNTQMVAQMAQFSSVAGISEMNTSLKGIAETLNATRIGDAAGWIGRNALVASDVAAPMADGSYAGEVAIEKDITQGTLSFVDANGQIVHNEALGAQKAGTIPYRWDGKDAAGNAVAGPLKMVVNARDASGSIKAATAAWTPVSGVQSPSGGAAARLVTAIGLIAPDDAIRLG